MKRAQRLTWFNPVAHGCKHPAPQVCRLGGPEGEAEGHEAPHHCAQPRPAPRRPTRSPTRFIPHLALGRLDLERNGGGWWRVHADGGGCARVAGRAVKPGAGQAVPACARGRPDGRAAWREVHGRRSHSSRRRRAAAGMPRGGWRLRTGGGASSLGGGRGRCAGAGGLPAQRPARLQHGAALPPPRRPARRGPPVRQPLGAQRWAAPARPRPRPAQSPRRPRGRPAQPQRIAPADAGGAGRSSVVLHAPAAAPTATATTSTPKRRLSA